MKKKTITKLILVLLLVTGMVFIYSSTMARIRKEITADIRIPDAKTFQGTLVVTYPASEVGLVDFAPGVTSEINRTDKNEDKSFSFVISNAQNIDKEDEKVSDVNLLFRIRVYGTGNMPMSMSLVDKKTGTVYVGQYTTDDAGVVYTFMKDGMEKEFKLEADESKEIRSNEFQLYLGWAERTGDTKYDSSDYEREVEVLELRILVEHEEEITDLSNPVVEPGKVKVDGSN